MRMEVWCQGLPNRRGEKTNPDMNQLKHLLHTQAENLLRPFFFQHFLTLLSLIMVITSLIVIITSLITITVCYFSQFEIHLKMQSLHLDSNAITMFPFPRYHVGWTPSWECEYILLLYRTIFYYYDIICVIST